MTPTRKLFSIENIQVQLRWVLPIMLGGYIVAYHNDIQWQKQQFNDMKISQDKMWAKIDNDGTKTDNRFAYVYQQCCSNASAPPIN